MIEKSKILEFLDTELADTNYFVVDVKVSANNEICIEVDSDENVDIDFCMMLSRKFEEAFSRDVEDYELEVGSAGLTSPFRVLRQYKKHIGDRVVVLTRDGKKLQGVLDDAGDEAFTVGVTEKYRPEGAKRPVERTVQRQFGYNEVKSVKYIFDF